MGASGDNFEAWVAAEGGPEAVVEMIADLRGQIDAGVLPGFQTKEEFLAYLHRSGRQSA